MFNDMGDLPDKWKVIKEVPGGGQGHTFVVSNTDPPSTPYFVFKRLINPKREGRFQQEIAACKSLDHPNILKIVEYGNTPRGRPYLISEYCDGGSLEQLKMPFHEPLDGLQFFKQVLDAIAYAHSRKPAISHLDLKPANIFLKERTTPIVGDFGICYIEDDMIAITSEGQQGSAYYCAPELRGPKIERGVAAKLADIYSLGKVLYWLFTKRVYDGSEEDYADDRDRTLAHLFPQNPHFTLVDDLISATVRRRPAQRPQSADGLKADVEEVIQRIKAGGRILDLRIPQRCLYCGKGKYQVLAMPPSADCRRRTIDPRQNLYDRPDAWSDMRTQTNTGLGMAFAGSGGVNSVVPINVICDFCGNIQTFRIDRVPTAMQNWNP